MLAEYDAAKVSPAENPTNQAWTEAGTGSGVTVEAIDDGGTPAWRILDNACTKHKLAQEGFAAVNKRVHGIQYDNTVHTYRRRGSLP